MPQQYKFSDNADWWHSLPQPRADLESVPFVGEVAGVTPAVSKAVHEIRRRDVGKQVYGSGIPTLPGAYTDRNGLLKSPNGEKQIQVPTAHGNITLTSNEQHLGYMPTASAVHFLKHEYLGSRFGAHPPRYYR
jgi:hypothetical protein